jgi:hypothetical protein
VLDDGVMRCWITSRSRWSKGGEPKDLSLLVEDPPPVGTFVGPNRSVELPDRAEDFFAVVAPFGRFSLKPPAGPERMWTLHFEDDYD